MDDDPKVSWILVASLVFIVLVATVCLNSAEAKLAVEPIYYPLILTPVPLPQVEAQEPLAPRAQRIRQGKTMRANVNEDVGLESPEPPPVVPSPEPPLVVTEPLPVEDPVQQCRRAEAEALARAPDLRFDWPFYCSTEKPPVRDAWGFWAINFETGEQSITVWASQIPTYREILWVTCHELGHAYLYRTGGDFGNESEADRIALEKCGESR